MIFTGATINIWVMPFPDARSLKLAAPSLGTAATKCLAHAVPMAGLCVRQPSLTSREGFFTELLEADAARETLKLTVAPTEGLGLALRKDTLPGEEIYRCKALKASAHPCFLPHACYCAALSSLLETESDLLPLQSLSRPDHVARRAPGIDGANGANDLTAKEILQDFDLPQDLLSLYSDLARIWKYNAFDTGDGRLAIFLLPSLCNHSCSPAAEYTLCEDDGAIDMILFSLHELFAGDALTICYIEDNEKHRTSRMARRNTLAEGWLFYCCCALCFQQLRCISCQEEMQIWISNIHGGPYEDDSEAPTCDVCGMEDLVVSGPYFFHCSSCEVDLCEKCAEARLGICKDT
eukprot:Skav222071  [mRNA]  locus=scaffold4586:1081:2358:- [translate_table: standard]